ncbi:MAG TPA: MlaD family protein [Candidatus Dormibacteraeota bacterium]|jgi:virulence factor Mce-like protein|nr:MlaD family protein [Candidatus Dormibacteraeota bacterium]
MLKDMLRYKPDARQVGGVVLALFLLLLGVAYMINRSYTLTFWDRGYELKADFSDADGIANASDVRIAGVYVGQVTGVAPKAGGLAEVTFRVDAAHAPLHAGTRVDLRLQTLLGQKFLDIQPGPASAPQIASDTTIPSTATQSPVDFDQLLSAFDKPTRDAVATLIQELGTATNGRGQDVNVLLTDLNNLSTNSTPDLQTFSDRGQNLDTILGNLANVGDNLATNRQHLANVQTQLNQVLGTLSTNDAGFRRFIEQGDASLGHGLAQYGGESRNIQASLNALRPVFDQLDPLLVQVDTDQALLDPITKIQRSLTPYIASSVGGYNANPNCPTSSSPGCGGFYLRQFVVFGEAPANTEVQAANPATARSPLGGAGSGLPAVPGLPQLIPGLTPPSGGSGLPFGLPGIGAPSANPLSAGYMSDSERNAVSAELLAYLLGS